MGVYSQQPTLPIATYRRTVAASIDRVWENVLDWEHLPYLHHDSVSAIDLLAAGKEGWRAEVKTTPELGGTESEIEVVLDRPRLRYVTKTLGGAGEGTEIWTALRPHEDGRTSIAVDFCVPGVPADQAEAIGGFYVSLYTRLWDQDESMMVERERLLLKRRERRPEPVSRGVVRLGPLASLRSRLPLTVEADGPRYRIVAHDGRLVAHAAECPHMGGPLDRALVSDGCITCPWHGYRFDVSTGASMDGRGLRLARAPRVRIEEMTDEVVLDYEP